MNRAFTLALVFLTRIPVPVRFTPQAEDWGRSVLYFPLVGLVIGATLVTLYAVLHQLLDSGVLAVLLLVVWTLATGGLHLDGLADAADAWIGGFGDREKTLTIMKDPRSGPIAIVVVVLVLLTKFAALQAVVEDDVWGALLWAPVLGRAGILLMLITTPYVRPEGVATAHAEYLPRLACKRLLIIIGVLVLGWWTGQGLVLLVLLGVGFLALRGLLLQRLGGATGDTLGATCELTEAVALTIMVSLLLK
ncbi:MAG: adenosylcobinamide-GDP ribazoletransferase [Candidatus Competibacteraceae bacterium]|jgi:adenosylcobinamide-GDP ribazoletransferase|nr:adenosylcobinamide-GDP ribazoletransferase [Candidatus Competibacteraceae bacterium]